jgi:glycerate-2-kinase
MGDIMDVSKKLPQILRKIFAEMENPFWFTGFGETTAKVHGKGKGGRNTELSLRVMLEMNKNEVFSLMSTATDGDDGNSGLMGMMVDDKLKRETLNADFKDYLDNSDSAGFARRYSVQVETGFTGTNVSDIIIGYYGGNNENINREE